MTNTEENRNLRYGPAPNYHSEVLDEFLNLKTMEETKKWWQSRTIQSGIALIIAGLAFFAVRFNIVDVAQLESAATVYPEVTNGIALIQAGQWFAGISMIAGALVVYFRLKATKVIS